MHAFHGRTAGRLSLLLLVAVALLGVAPARAQRTAAQRSAPTADAMLRTGLVGDWWEGTLSTIQFYDPTSGTWAPPNGTGTFLQLRADGSFRTGGVLTVTTGACTSTLLVDEHGTYTATGADAGQLVLARQTGHSRATNTCTTQVYDRDLEPETRTFAFSLGTDGQGRETLTRSENGSLHSTMRRWATSNPPPGSGLVGLRAFDPAGPQTISLIDQVAPLDSGFVFGTNHYGDRQKAQHFTLPGSQTSGELAEVDVYFAHRGTTGLFYGISVYAGTPESGPVGDPLAVHVFDYERIQVDGNSSTPSPATVHRFETPVAVGHDFFVTVRSLPDGYAPRNLAVASTEFTPSRVAGVWEQWSDGTWHNVSDAWWGDGSPGSGVYGASLWIEARVRGGAVAGEPDAEASGIALAPVAPNPVRGAASLTVVLPHATEATLDVVDVTGRVVARLADGPFAAGETRVAFDAHALAPGVYVARLRTGGAVVTQRLTVVR